MRLFLQFAAKAFGRKITQLGLDDLDADTVSRFLNSLEEDRSNAVPQSEISSSPHFLRVRRPIGSRIDLGRPRR